MRERVRITDVSPRDGLQNEAGVISARSKADLVLALCGAGVDEVEVTSFVSPKWVPQLGDGADVCGLVAAALGGNPRPVFSALVPNEKGMEAALEVNRRAGRRVLDKVSVFTAASETFSRRNTNASIAETLERFRPVLKSAAVNGLAVRLYVSCVVACPFEGAVSVEQVERVAREALTLLGESGVGAVELDLGDTIGAATPDTLAPVIERVQGLAAWKGLADPASALVVHLHDTFGRAGACVTRALAMGVRSFDGSAGGLGGCPYASTPGKRAPGNISTETLVRAAQAAGYTTGVDLTALGGAGALAVSLVAGTKGAGDDRV